MELLEGVATAVGVAVLIAFIAYYLYELSVRGFGAYACSDEPGGAELWAQFAFFLYRGIAPRSGPELG